MNTKNLITLTSIGLLAFTIATPVANASIELNDTQQAEVISAPASGGLTAKQLAEETKNGETRTVKNVGGGTWQYGENMHLGYTTSRYYHRINKHSSTVQSAKHGQRHIVAAGKKSNAEMRNSPGNLAVYWNNTPSGKVGKTNW